MTATRPAAKQARGRPVLPGSLTGSERTAIWRKRHNLVTCAITADVAAALDALAVQHGDPSRGAAIERLLRRPAPG